MADLTTTITENVVLNGSVRGSLNTLTTTGIVDVFERIVTCTHSQTTKVANFAATPHTSAGAIDVDRTKYIRLTNLDTEGTIELAVVGTATNYTVQLPPLTSHILARGAAVVLAEEDTTPSFGTLEDLTSLQVRPEGTSYNPRVEIFIAVSE